MSNAAGLLSWMNKTKQFQEDLENFDKKTRK
jgi:hypothetical protein